ncbi:hypothetical protein BCM20_001430 [Clostridium beijerinckii]|uniref:Uncharacterized protein n=1 Tax=Clostridium beijerinckii TaxID=1520 RepID=A0AAX0BA31_CLOBE|nr:hypothetical protein [Clostridium beijerinckii]NYC01475.1 hypothetical protein [Clostridium beijerinckii]NYC71607.1 hypothetical protein [Clostridium beijerinckii]
MNNKKYYQDFFNGMDIFEGEENIIIDPATLESYSTL